MERLGRTQDPSERVPLHSVSQKVLIEAILKRLLVKAE